MPAANDVGRGDVKAPPLWHTAAKMPVKRWYVDGSFHGPFPLMASSMELEKDRSFDALAQVVMPVIKDEFVSVIRHLRPPRYPYDIDRALAARGRDLFYSTDIGCYRCHGVYDGRGNVDWPGVHTDIGTDRSRIDVVSDQFIDAFNGSPLATDGALRKSRGYAATPLTGVIVSTVGATTVVSGVAATVRRGNPGLRELLEHVRDGVAPPELVRSGLREPDLSFQIARDEVRRPEADEPLEAAARNFPPGNDVGRRVPLFAKFENLRADVRRWGGKAESVVRA